MINRESKGSPVYKLWYMETKTFISGFREESGGSALSDDWFFDSGRVRAPRSNYFPILVIILIVIGNFVVVAFYVNNANRNVVRLNSEVETLNQEIETLRFQLQSANFELSALKDAIQTGRPGNASAGLELTQLYNRTRRSVVLITVRTGSGGGQGSGFVYDEDGRIITNNHVVEGAVEDGITVTFIDGTIVPATIVGTDPYVDLAVIAVDASPFLLRPVTMGSSSELLVGERVIALGNPFGLADTMTAGIVSAVGRQMDAPGGYAIVDVIQTDAAINPGNSGGPLLNMEGEVVGMNTAIVSDTRQFSGVGFAIAADTITREVPSLIETGKYDHPYLGIRGMGLIPSVNEAMDLDENTRGALVTEVVDGTPADEAGLQGGDRDVDLEGFPVRVGGDVIIGVDGRAVKDLYDLVVYLERTTRPGDSVTFTIIRDKDVMELDLVLGVRPSP
jgi:S1-C subfamily serine protease